MSHFNIYVDNEPAALSVRKRNSGNTQGKNLFQFFDHNYLLKQKPFLLFYIY